MSEYNRHKFAMEWMHGGGRDPNGRGLDEEIQIANDMWKERVSMAEGGVPQLVQPRQGFYKKGFVKQKPTAQHLEIAKNYYEKPFHKLTNKQQLRIKGGTTTGKGIRSIKKVASIEDSALVKKAEKVLKKNIKNKNGYKVFKIEKGVMRDKVKPGGLIDQLMDIGLKDQHKITKLIDEIAEKNNWLTRDVYRRNVIVDSFMKDYGEFDEFTGRGKYDPRLEEFKIKTPENEYKWINNTFEEWRDGKFEVEGYDRKKFDKNLKKNLKNWKPINLSKKMIATQEELKWLDQMNTKHPNWSVEKVEKAFNKQFKNSEFFMDTSFNNRALDLYPHKMVGNNKGYTVKGVGEGKRSNWLSQIMRENRGGNYTKMLLASEAFENKGNIQAARKLKEGAELFFGKKGIFTKMGGEAEHPWFRNYGGWEGEFKIDSLVKGDLNAFKASNFDFPVRDLIKKYEAKGVSDAMKAKLKSEIELRKNFLNFFTDIGDGGMAKTITFDFDTTPGKVKVINTTPSVYRLHKEGKLDPFEMAERGKLYRKTLVENLGGSFLKKDETIKGAKIGSERMVNMLKEAGFKIDKCLKLAKGGSPDKCIRGVIEDTAKKARGTGKEAKAAQKIFKKSTGLASKALWFLGPLDVPIEMAFALPHLLMGDYDGAKRATTFGLAGWGEIDFDKIDNKEAQKYLKHKRDTNAWIDNWRTHDYYSEKLKNLPEGSSNALRNTIEDKIKKHETNMQNIYSTYEGYDRSGSENEDWAYNPEEMAGKKATQEFIRNKVQEDLKNRIDLTSPEAVAFGRGEKITDEDVKESLRQSPKDLESYIASKGEDFYGDPEGWFWYKPLVQEEAEAHGVPEIFDDYFMGAAEGKDIRDAYSSIPLDYASQLGALEAKETREGLEAYRRRNQNPLNEMYYNKGGRVSYFDGGIASLKKK